MKYIKQFAAFSASLLVLACSQESKQSSIAGNIKNLPNSVTEAVLRTPNQTKKIKITNGAFKDTINIDNKFCFIKIGDFEKTLFLDKNSQLVINADAKDYDNSLSYSGKGEKVNNYLNEREKYTYKIFDKIDSINTLDPDAFAHFNKTMVSDIEAMLKNNSDINEYVIEQEKIGLSQFSKNLEQQYNTVNQVVTSFKQGDASPEFTDLENYKGGTTSLKDLRGNYVYVDIWATWCPPCKVEIPFLKKLEEKFHKKNIKFVSLSIDNPNAKDAWKKMIQDKKMGGIQLFANGNTSFVDAYNVTGIPRFILIDTEGNIISDNAPRPSSDQIHDLLSSLK